MSNFLQHAIQYHEAGLKIIPAYETKGGGYTFCKDWKNYRESQTREQVEQLFSRPAWGLAILCTEGLEVIDIDTKHDPFGNIDKQYFDEVFWMSGDETLLPTCTTQKTKSGGWHLVYKCSETEGNSKLTMREGSREAVIETRGQGGLIFAYPTPGYEVKRGSLTDIKTISPDQRQTLWTAARQLSSVQEIEQPKKEHPAPTSSMPTSGGLTPWDDYNNQHRAGELLERAGWVQCKSNSQWTYYTKPDGTRGNIHGAVNNESGIFIPFTTGTAFEDMKGYTAYAIHTVLDHRGNFSESARALSRAGYGERQAETNQSAQVVATTEGKQLSPYDYVMTTRFDINDSYEEPPCVLDFKYDGQLYELASLGEVVPFTGPEKSGKTFMMSKCVASALSGKRVFGWKLAPTQKRIIYFDCEQGRKYYRRTQNRIFRDAGLTQLPSNYEAYNLRRLSKRQRLDVIEQILAPGNIDYIFLDGIVDINSNFNDVEASEETVDISLRWTDVHNALLFPVLHTAAGGWMKGHLGKILANKADTVVKSEYDKMKQLFQVSNPTARDRPFPSWDYGRDDRGRAYLADGYAESDETDEPEPQAEVYNPNITTPTRNDDDDIPF